MDRLDRTQDDPATDPIAAAPDRRRARRLVAVAAGTTIALGGGGIAYAATTDQTPTPTPSASTPEEFEGRGPHGPHVAIGPGFGGMPLHGEQVVETEDGTYQTIASQRGTIDEITEDTLVVTSEDGYTATYVLDADTLDGDDHPGPITDPADLAVGDEVMVMATIDSDTSTVHALIDLADLPDRPAFGGPGPRLHDLPDEDDETAPETATS
jgi:hypothetical protein